MIDVGLWVVGLGPSGSWCNGRHDGFAFVEVCCGGFVCVCVCVCVCFARQRDVFASLSFFFLLVNLGFVIVMAVDL